MFSKYPANRMQKSLSALLREATRPAIPVFVIQWIFGVLVIEYPIGTPRPFISYFYVFCLLSIYFGLVIYSLPFLDMLFKELKYEHNMIVLLFYLHVALAIITTVLGLIRSKGTYKILRMLIEVDEVLESIGIKKDYAHVFRAQLRKLTGYAIYILIVLIINSLTLILIVDNSQRGKLISSLVTNYPIVTNFICDVQFININNYVQKKINEINNLLKSMITTIRSPVRQYKLFKSMCNTSDEPLTKLKDQTVLVDQSHVIYVVRKSQLECVKVVRVTNDIFGLHILVSVIMGIGIMTIGLYQNYKILSQSNLPSVVFFGLLANNCNWLVYYFIKTFAISYACNSLINKTLETGDVIAKLYDEPSITESTRSEIQEFTKQLFLNPLTFKAFGFIAVDFSLIQMVIGSVTTYLMIFLQLQNPE